MNKKTMVLFAIVLIIIAFFAMRNMNHRIPDSVRTSLRAMQKAITLDPKSIPLNYELAVLQLRSGHIFKTINTIRKVDSLKNDSKVALGDLLKNYIPIYTDAVKKSPNTTEKINNLYNISFIYIASNDYQTALKKFIEITTLDTKEHFAFACQGFIYGRYLNKPDIAFPLIQKAITMSPKNPLYVYLLSEGYRMRGDTVSANKLKNKAYWYFILGY